MLTSAMTLRYSSPAEEWTSALPLGNGRLGVMAFGGPLEERLQINDGTAWSGSPASESLPPRVDTAGAAEALATARTAIDEGRFHEAVPALQRLQHRHSQSYVAFADLALTTTPGGAVTAYERRLDLDTAQHTVRYELDGAPVVRELFVSRPDQVAVLRITTERPGGIDLALAVSTPVREESRTLSADRGVLAVRLPAAVAPPVDDFDEPIEYSDDPTRSMTGVLALGWHHDGTADPARALAATGVTAATVVFTTDTTFTALGADPGGTTSDIADRALARVEAALTRPLAELRRRQQSDHGSLFERAELRTADDGASLDRVSLDERLRVADTAEGGALAADPGLAALLYNYGRYLLIGSSRAGGVPANLQGIWNDQVQPMWSSNYTTNINLEMNYWAAEVAGLPECAEPLFDLIDALAESGRETAQRIYGAPGWVAHHNTDVWAYTQPVGWGRHNPRWAFWPLAAAWLCQHLREHLAFGADPEFAERAFTPMRGAAEFFLAWLVDQPDGTLGTVPSTSPENEFITDDGAPAPADRSSAMDLALVADLFDGLQDVAALVGRQLDPVVVAARTARARIPGPVIAVDGMVAEWPADRPQIEPDHRHVSHLWFAYPGHTPLTPSLAAAVSASLDGRGDESTGWSLAWKLALRARLGQPGKVSDLLRLVYRGMSTDRGVFGGGLYPNLFSAHPPFQVDGNFGFVAGLTETLLQSHAGRIELLPAVPVELGEGSLRGAVARPGVRVDLDWQRDEAGRIVPARVVLQAVGAGAFGRHSVTFGTRSTTVELPDTAAVEVPVALLV